MKITHNDILWSKTLPDYCHFQDMVIAAIDLPKNAPLHCLEFGVGLADTSKRLLSSYSEARLSMVDECEGTLNDAYTAFTEDIQSKTHTIHATFQDFETDEKFDVSFSALSFHHLKRSEQIELFQKIWWSACDWRFVQI
jgi:trans-aconitate methyltransferase